MFVADVDVDVPRVLESLGMGTPAKTRESWLDYRCPFHEERRPSFSIHAETGSWIDRHGGERGSLLDLVCYSLKVDRADAARWVRGYELAQQTAVAIVARLLGRRGRKVQENAEAEGELLQWASEYDSLDPNSMARYFFDRGFNVKTVRSFGVRYDPVSLSLMWPARDTDANTVGFTRRFLPEANQRAKYLYPKSQPRLLWPLDTFAPDPLLNSAIIVEGQLDAMWLHQLGYTSALSVSGTGLTDVQFQWLFAHVRRCILFYDNDSAGRLSNALVKERLVESFDVREAVYPPGPKKDPQELTSTEVHSALRNARGLIDTLLYRGERSDQEQSSDRPATHQGGTV